MTSSGNGAAANDQPQRRARRIAVASLALAVATVPGLWVVDWIGSAWPGLLEDSWVRRLPVLLHLPEAALVVVMGLFPSLALVLGAVALRLTWPWSQRAQRWPAVVAGLVVAASGVWLTFIASIALSDEGDLIVALSIGIVVGLAIMLRLRRVDSLSVAGISLALGALSLISVWAWHWRFGLAGAALVLAVGVLAAGRSRRPRLATLAAVSAVVAAVFGGVPAPWVRWTAITDHVWCAGNMRELPIYALMYHNDYDRLPDADTWSDALLPYVGHGGLAGRPRLLFICLRAVQLESGYAFNRALSGFQLSETIAVGDGAEPVELIEDPGRVVLLFESDLGWNGAGGIDDLPERPRHRGRHVVAFLDGSHRSVTPAEARTLIWEPRLLR